jgi:hypothetical protein
MEEKSLSFKPLEFNKITFTPDQEDMASECNAYMKIKHFMSKRIYDQEEEIEELKNLILSQGIIQQQMSESLKVMSETIHNLRNRSPPKMRKKSQKHVHRAYSTNNSQDNSLNFSGEFIESLYESEDEKKNQVSMKKKLSQKSHNKLSCFNNKINYNEEEQNKIISLSNENIDLKRENEELKLKLMDKDLKINKLQTDKTLILNELLELVSSLKKIDSKILNKFYLSNCINSKDRNLLPTTMGIQYNLMSAQSQLLTILNPSRRFRENNNKFLNKNENKDSEDTLNLKKYFSISSHYEQEFHQLLDTNLKRHKMYFSSS